MCEEIAAMGRQRAPDSGQRRSPESVKEMFGEFRAAFGRLDIVVSNAASGVLKPAMEMTLKHWRWCLETNALALNLLAQRRGAADDGMAHGSSRCPASASRFAMPDYGFIGASKAALESLVRTLAVELGPRGIRVNAVSAAVVDTDALKVIPATRADARRVRAAGPAGARALLPAHVADAVFLLCLPEAAMITGQTLVVDGGFSISG